MPRSRTGGSQSEESQRAGVSSEQKQKTISELFATSKTTSARPDAAGLQDSCPRKRMKHTHTVSTIDVPFDTAAAMNSSPPTSSSRVNGVTNTAEVIDLTASPGPAPPKISPSRKRLSGSVRPTSFVPTGGPKKLVVKNLRTTPRTDPDQYYNHVWNQVDSALSAIFSGGNLPCSLEELYKGVESLCKQDRAAAVYKKLREKCKCNVSVQILEPLLQQVSPVTDIDLLEAVVRAWSMWKSQLTTIRSIFFYLDRSYLLQSPNLESIEDMGISAFRTHVYANIALKKKTIQGAYDLLAADREASLDTASKVLFVDSIQMFHALGVYTKDFGPKVIGDSEKYLLSWADRKGSSSDLPGYVSECHKLIESEAERCIKFGLDLTTRDTLVLHIEDITVERKQDVLLNFDNISKLLDSHNLLALERLYALLRRKQLCEKLRPPFEAYILRKGADIIFDETREQEMVPRLLDFQLELDEVWLKSFQKHQDLGHTLRESFEAFINKSKRSNMTWGTDNPKPGEMIAKYVDMILKGGTKAIANTTTDTSGPKSRKAEDNAEDSSADEETEISNQLDQVLELFRFVHGKAVFEAFYKRDLARRLLLGRSASADAEKMMLTRLKSECGAGFTHNLEQMFKDIEMAREENVSYRSMREERRITSSIDLNVNVLSASAWPSYPDVAVEVPRVIQSASASFEAHYKNKHTGRRLAWKHGLAHCQLKANFPKGNKEIVVSAFQAIILLHFNGKDLSEAVPYTEIQAASNLDDTELKRTMQSLACAKYRVLSKTPKGREVNNTDVFTINGNFSDPKYRIKINQVQAKETKQENKETHERVAADRNFETQAAIVRIMKSRKMITHVELISEVIVATRSRGVLDPADIKKNIEKLIEKDYMERDETKDGRNGYSYLA